jgi:hypothetical protein
VLDPAGAVLRLDDGEMAVLVAPRGVLLEVGDHAVEVLRVGLVLDVLEDGIHQEPIFVERRPCCNGRGGAGGFPLRNARNAGTQELRSRAKFLRS